MIISDDIKKYAVLNLFRKRLLVSEGAALSFREIHREWEHVSLRFEDFGQGVDLLLKEETLKAIAEPDGLQPTPSGKSLPVPAP